MVSLRRVVVLGVFLWALYELVGEGAKAATERAIGRATRP